MKTPTEHEARKHVGFMAMSRDPKGTSRGELEPHGPYKVASVNPDGRVELDRPRSVTLGGNVIDRQLIDLIPYPIANGAVRLREPDEFRATILFSNQGQIILRQAYPDKESALTVSRGLVALWLDTITEDRPTPKAEQVLALE